MNKKLCYSLAVLSVAAAAYGQSIQYSANTAGFTPPVGPGDNLVAYGQTGFIPIPRWNPASFPGATLVGVTYQVTVYSGLAYTIYEGINPQVLLTATSLSIAGPTLTSPGLSGANADIPLQNVAIGSGLIGSPGTTSGVLNDLANLGAYQGAGSVLFKLTGTGVAFVGGGEGVNADLNPGMAGRVVVTYDYRFPVVPEAGTYAAVGFLAALGGWSVYRRRTA